MFYRFLLFLFVMTAVGMPTYGCDRILDIAEGPLAENEISHAKQVWQAFRDNITAEEAARFATAWTCGEKRSPASQSFFTQGGAAITYSLSKGKQRARIFAKEITPAHLQALGQAMRSGVASSDDLQFTLHNLRHAYDYQRSQLARRFFLWGSASCLLCLGGMALYAIL